MDASILLVGSDNFLTTFLEPIRDLGILTVEVASDPYEAAPLIQAQQPDLLILQANQPHNLALCRQIKSQSRLAWIYCILIEDGSANPDPDLEHQLLIQAEALEVGADAYLTIELNAAARRSPVAMAILIRLFHAQVKAGLRRVQNHRELMRTNDLLSAIALSDPLTELNNRRALEWELPRQIRNARDRDVPISLLMLDVDHFKAINDTYGHLVGDRALKVLAARMRHNLRFFDTPFRYGGEEFVIILADTNCQEAILIARRLCRQIGEQPFNLDESLDLTITISAGTASLQIGDDDRGLSLLQRADQNLLKAKSQGRNRVVGCPDCCQDLEKPNLSGNVEL